MRELATTGVSAVPYLVDALGDGSCEVRVRARLLLSLHNSFEEVAPYLVAAVEKPHGVRARELLRERALTQVAAVCGEPEADKLFKFWGSSSAAYHDRVLTQLTEAKTEAQMAQAVAPLLGLSAKVTRFSESVTRLEKVGLPYESPYEPGAVIAQTLARGLGENHAEWLAFAEQHLTAYEKLVAALKRQNAPPHAVRKELADRVNMSQGAAQFLVQILDERTPLHTIVTRRIGLTARYLTGEFCRGVASTDSTTYDRSVGRVHIVDMLSDTLRKWPAAPENGVVQRLVTSTTQTAINGDKPKALAFLDALDACRELSGHGLDVGTGWGQQLAERLYAAAAAAPNNRVYYPARRFHDKMVALADQGVSPEHDAFPHQLLQNHLRGAAEATSDDQLLALERYLRILDRLRTAGLTLEQPGVKRFILALRDNLSARHEILAAAVTGLDQRLGSAPLSGGKIDRDTADRALGEWTEQLLAIPPARRLGNSS
jgi:hypothetical protein